MPVKKSLDKSKTVNFVSNPIWEGNGPVKELTAKLKNVKLEKDPSWEGNGPAKKLFDKSKYVKPVLSDAIRDDNEPLSALLLKSKNVNRGRDPIWAGTCPVKPVRVWDTCPADACRVSDITSAVRACKLPNSNGKLPVKALPVKFKSIKFERDPISVGMDPFSDERDKSNDVKLVSFPIVLGMVPVQALAGKVDLEKDWRLLSIKYARLCVGPMVGIVDGMPDGGMRLGLIDGFALGSLDGIELRKDDGRAEGSFEGF